MYLKKIITIAIILVLNSCNYFIMTGGKVNFISSVNKITFEERYGLPIIKVWINGNCYDFLFDTGATNVISKELAEKLQLKTKALQGVIDSQRKKSVLKMGTLDSLTIENTKFYNTGVIIADLKKAKSIECMNIDGVIGSNLMKLAVWEINYENKTINFANSRKALNIPPKTTKINFKSDPFGAIYIDMYINEQKVKNLIFDTGSNGGINCSKKTFNKLRKKNKNLNYNYSYGIHSSGLFGEGKPDSTFYSYITNFKIGDFYTNSHLIEFDKKSSNTIGNEFLKPHKIVLDWNKKEILISTPPNNINQYKSFGFGYIINSNNKVFISYIINNSQAQKQGLLIEDQIIKINNMDITETEYCFIDNEIYNQQDSLSITILRNHKTMHYKLVKSPILNF